MKVTLHELRSRHKNNEAVYREDNGNLFWSKPRFAFKAYNISQILLTHEAFIYQGHPNWDAFSDPDFPNVTFEIN